MALKLDDVGDLKNDLLFEVQVVAFPGPPDPSTMGGAGSGKTAEFVPGKGISPAASGAGTSAGRVRLHGPGTIAGQGKCAKFAAAEPRQRSSVLDMFSRMRPFRAFPSMLLHMFRRRPPRGAAGRSRCCRAARGRTLRSPIGEGFPPGPAASGRAGPCRTEQSKRQFTHNRKAK
jgi:hypothetical protein